MLEWARDEGIRRISLTTEPGSRAMHFYLRAGWTQAEGPVEGEVHLVLPEEFVAQCGQRRHPLADAVESGADREAQLGQVFVVDLELAVDLGSLWEALPPDALNHDPYAYLNGEVERAA